MSQRCSEEEVIRNVGEMHFSGMPELKVRQQEAGRGLGESNDSNGFRQCGREWMRGER